VKAFHTSFGRHIRSLQLNSLEFLQRLKITQPALVVLMGSDSTPNAAF
jgi:hypothetical protein